MQMKTIVGAVSVVLGVAGIGSAAIIAPSPAPVVSGAGVASVIVSTSSPNNDNAVIPGGTISVIGKNFTSIGPIDIVFPLTSSGGTTEYFVSEGITNSTGQTWVGFKIELGFGSGTGFVASTSIDALDFDKPNSDPTPASTAFSTLVHGDDLISWSNGSIPSGGVMSKSFSIDIPDSLGVGTVTLRQTPIIPEPASMLAGGLVLTMLRRRR
jgi:hypothetical protein